MGDGLRQGAANMLDAASPSVPAKEGDNHHAKRWLTPTEELSEHGKKVEYGIRKVTQGLLILANTVAIGSLFIRSEDRSRTWAHEVGELLFSDKNEIRRQLERERGREPATMEEALLGAVTLLIVNNAIAVGIPLALRVLLDRRMRDEKAVTP